MADPDHEIESALDGLDQQRRDALKRLVKGSAFVAPVVASFAMQGIAIRPAHAASSRNANSTKISDVRVKRAVMRVGTHPSGCGVYRFKYLWSDTRYIGVIAQDVVQHAPHAVVAGPGGLLAVDYAALGLTMQAVQAH